MWSTRKRYKINWEVACMLYDTRKWYKVYDARIWLMSSRFDKVVNVEHILDCPRPPCHSMKSDCQTHTRPDGLPRLARLGRAHLAHRKVAEALPEVYAPHLAGSTSCSNWRDCQMTYLHAWLGGRCLAPEPARCWACVPAQTWAHVCSQVIWTFGPS